MPIPIEFPDWMPWWLQLLVVVAALLLGLAFAMMPFSVFGLKSRLEGVEATLEDIQSELRNLAHRLPEPGREPYDEPAVLRASAPLREPPKPPPIPPASWQVEPLLREVPPAPAKEREQAPVQLTPVRAVEPRVEPVRVEPVRESLSPTLRAAARVGEAARERAEPRLSRPKP